MDSNTKNEGLLEQAANSVPVTDDEKELDGIEDSIESLISLMRDIRHREAVGVKARRLALAITQLELVHAYWLAYIIDGEYRGC